MQGFWGDFDHTCIDGKHTFIWYFENGERETVRDEKREREREQEDVGLQEGSWSMVKTLVTGSLRMKGESGKGRKIEKTQVFRKGVVLGRSAIGSLRPWNERVRRERERGRGRGRLCLSILLVSLLFCIMLVSFLPVWLQETTFSLNRRADTLLFIYLPSKVTGGSLKPINSWSHSMQTTTLPLVCVGDTRHELTPQV